MNEIKFNKKLYSRKIIEDLFDAYQSFASFSAEEDQHYYTIKINNPDEEYKDILPFEIMNFAFALMFDSRKGKQL